jgi:hypothetical protein
MATNSPAYSEKFKRIKKNIVESSHCLSTLVASSLTYQFFVGALMEIEKKNSTQRLRIEEFAELYDAVNKKERGI